MELLPSNGGVVDQLFSDVFTQVFMGWQLFGDKVGVGQFRNFPHTVNQHYLLEALVHFRILDQAHKRRQAGTGGEHVEVAARQ